ncbi:NAD(P)/FAD-dependent oxidoreductase [Nocardioides lentus]|uniref:NAD(P)/FAD-dependent oxidoreductase n=1 Tax=Nocardioides lentus TaxID=338077 RepID=A0ABP5B5T6_9ACTN
MHVIIAGGGIGGLALARGLRRADVEVTVLERDTDLRRTGGYSLHLQAEALDGLRELLAPEAVEQLYAVSQGAWNQRGFAIRDHRGRLIAVDRSVSAEDSLDVDRVTLRLLLADTLDDALRRGARVTGYEREDGGDTGTGRGGGRVAALLDDGSRVVGDVLVAADGVGSAIATRLAGGPTSAPIGLVGLAGRTPEGAVAPAGRAMLGNRSTLAVGPGGSGLYVGHHAPLDQAAVRSFTGPPPLGVEPSYVWGVILLDWAGTAALRSVRGADLVAAAEDELARRHWGGELLDVVRRADPGTTSSFRFHAAPRYAAGLAVWPAGEVTALGDAVHAMPPTGGRGASTAIQDAHVLHRELLAARDGHKTVPMAVHDYQRAMRPYAAAAVAESLQPVGWIRASAKPLGAAVARAGLPAAAAVAWAVRSARHRQGG